MRDEKGRFVKGNQEGFQKGNAYGNNRKGKKHSEEAKKKISLSLANNKNHLGKYHSEETKAIIRNKLSGMKMPYVSKSNKNRICSEETRRKRSESLKGNKNAVGNKNLLGFKFSEESKNKISKTHKEKNLKGNKSKSWKGGKFTSSRGYVEVFKPEHPHCKTNHYVLEHRLVIEEYLGRYLNPEEQIHHINEIKDDNRLENLMLFENGIEHRRYHSELKRKQKLCVNSV